MIRHNSTMLRRFYNSIISSMMLFLNKGINPQTLIFFITSRCNATCDFCLYKDFLNDKASKDSELSLDEIERLSKQYGKLHFLSLSGGEPFIRRDIVDICELFIKNSATKVVDIPSNCFYTERIVDSLTQLCERNENVMFQLQLSLDHIGTEHDRIRGVKGLYEKAKRTFNELNDLDLKNLKLNINIVYLDDNKKEIPAIISKAKSDFNCDRITLGYLNNLIKKNELSDSFYDFKKTSNQVVVEGISKIINPFVLGMKAVTLLTNDLLEKALSEEVKTSKYCKAGENIVVVTEKGDVFPCEPTWESIGSLRDFNYDIRRVLNSNKYHEFYENMLKNSDCNCSWSCAMTSAVATDRKLLLKLPPKIISLFGELAKNLVK